MFIATSFKDISFLYKTPYLLKLCHVNLNGGSIKDWTISLTKGLGKLEMVKEKIQSNNSDPTIIPKAR